MDCNNLSYDNRETCINVVSSSCVPYTGYISAAAIATTNIPECKPNINDLFKAIQTLIDKINTGIGNNTTLDKKCLTISVPTVTQKELNQLYIDELCAIKAQLALLGGPIDPSTIELAINMLCLTDPTCDLNPTYTLDVILTRLVNAYCGLLTRVTAIETILNI